MDWIIYRVEDMGRYTVTELKCPKCGMRKTLTWYRPNAAIACEVCDEVYNAPELGGGSDGT